MLLIRMQHEYPKVSETAVKDKDKNTTQDQAKTTQNMVWVWIYSHQCNLKGL